MLERLTAAGFVTAFTPLFWSYALDMPKVSDAAQLAMNRLGDDGLPVGRRLVNRQLGDSLRSGEHRSEQRWQQLRLATDPRAIAMEGAKLGFQPKPAVEVILVAMKPLAEASYLDQALATGKGVT